MDQPPVRHTTATPATQTDPASPTVPATPAGPAPLRRTLGTLSERYESGGRGPGTVSTGRNDPGGISYGLYQLASRTGAVAQFLAGEGARWAPDFGVAAPGSPAFSAVWRAIATRAPEAFAQAQHGFIERSHYRPAVAAVLARTGLDLTRRSAALQDVCWSCAVQHGAAARLIAGAVAVTDAQLPRTAPDYDRWLIEAIYAARSEHVLRLAARAAPGSAATLRGLAERRYPAERAAALAMLETDGGARATGLAEPRRGRA